MSQQPRPNTRKRVMISMHPKNHQKMKIYSSSLSLSYQQLINQMLNKGIEELEKEKFTEEFVRNVNNGIIAEPEHESPLIS